jgi:hypothetical protein
VWQATSPLLSLNLLHPLGTCTAQPVFCPHNTARYIDIGVMFYFHKVQRKERRGEERRGEERRGEERRGKEREGERGGRSLGFNFRFS